MFVLGYVFNRVGVLVNPAVMIIAHGIVKRIVALVVLMDVSMDALTHVVAIALVSLVDVEWLDAVVLV